MASIGSIRSTALTGEDKPVFKNAEQVKKVSQKVDKTHDTIVEQGKQIAELSAALAKLLKAQGETTEEDSDDELSPQEKAAKTRAANKAKAEQEAEQEEETK